LKIANSKYVAAPLGFVSASQKIETVGAIASASYPAWVIHQLKPVEQQPPSLAEKSVEPSQLPVPSMDQIENCRAAAAASFRAKPPSSFRLKS